MTADGKHHGDTPQTAPPAGFSPWRDVVLVMTFLTRLPLPPEGQTTRPLASAAWAFPLAGIITGGVGGGIFYGASSLGAPALIAISLGLAASILLGGGLHEDGLADVADGFGGGGTREEKLEIMRDSRIGAYGVLALIFSVGLRVAALLAITGQAGVQIGFAVFLAAAVFSRGMLPAVMSSMPNARTDGLSKNAGQPGFVGVALSLILGLLGAVTPLYSGYLPAMVSAFGAIAAVFVLCLIARRQIGGQTGDVIGAAQQIGEIAFLVMLSAALAGDW